MFPTPFVNQLNKLYFPFSVAHRVSGSKTFGENPSSLTLRLLEWTFTVKFMTGVFEPPVTEASSRSTCLTNVSKIFGYKMLVWLGLLNNHITFYFFSFVPFIGTGLQPLDMLFPLTFESEAASLRTAMFNIQKCFIVLTLRLCVSYWTRGRQRHLPCAWFTDRFLQPWWKVFSARYGLNTYIRQITFSLSTVKVQCDRHKPKLNSPH